MDDPSDADLDGSAEKGTRGKVLGAVSGTRTDRDGRASQADRSVAEQVEEYWGWAAGALFLLVTLDLLTTLYAAAAVGVAAESNPVTAWLLGRSVPALVGVNVAAAAVAAVCFRGLMATYRLAPAGVRPYYGLLIELWLGALLAAGLGVFANNLAVIVLGRSLVPA